MTGKSKKFWTNFIGQLANETEMKMKMVKIIEEVGIAKEVKRSNSL